MDELLYWVVGVLAIVAYALSGWMDGRKRENDERRDATAAHQEIRAIREHLASMPHFDAPAYAVLEHRVEALEAGIDNTEQLRAAAERVRDLGKIIEDLDRRLSGVEKSRKRSK